MPLVRDLFMEWRAASKKLMEYSDERDLDAHLCDDHNIRCFEFEKDHPITRFRELEAAEEAAAQKLRSGLDGLEHALSTLII
jgi:hypothetical protein